MVVQTRNMKKKLYKNSGDYQNYVEKIDDALTEYKELNQKINDIILSITTLEKLPDDIQDKILEYILPSLFEKLKDIRFAIVSYKKHIEHMEEYLNDTICNDYGNFYSYEQMIRVLKRMKTNYDDDY